MSGKPFWMVCRAPRSPQAQTQPRQRYDSLAEAEGVAQRLANQEAAPFTVLEAVSTIYPDDGPKDLFAGT